VFLEVGGQFSNIAIPPLDYDSPFLASVFPLGSPTEGGVNLVITGTNFGVSGTVTIDGNLCQLVGEYNHSYISCVTPAGQGGDVSLILLVEGQQSNFVSFAYDAPRLDSVEPDFGSTGVL